MKKIFLFYAILFLLSIYSFSKPPLWVETYEFGEYSKETHIVGVGISDKSFDEAKALAGNDIAKQIRLKIKSKLEDLQQEFSIDGKTIEIQDTKSHIVIETKAELYGAQIIKKEQDGKYFYVFAVLDKNKYAEWQLENINNYNNIMSKYVEEGKKYFYQGDVNVGMEKILDGYKYLFKLEEASLLLSAVRGPGQVNKYMNIADFDNLFDKLAKSINIKLLSSSYQEVSLNRTLDEEIKVEITVKNDEGKVNISDGNVFVWYNKNKDNRQKLNFKNGLFSYNFKYQDGINYVNIMPAILGLNKSLEKFDKIVYVTMKKKDSISDSEILSKTYKVKIKFKPLDNKKVNSDLLFNDLKTNLEKYNIFHTDNATIDLEVSLKEIEVKELKGLGDKFYNLKLLIEFQPVFFKKKGDKVQFEISGGGKGYQAAYKNAINQMKIKNDNLSNLMKSLEGASTYLPERQENKKKIAVLDLINNNSYPYFRDYSRSLSDMITSELTSNGYYRVLERKEIEKIKSELRFSNESEFTDKNTVKEIGKMLNVDYLLLGSISFLDENNFEVDIRIVDIESGEIIKSANEEGTKNTKLRNIATKLVEKITE